MGEKGRWWEHLEVSSGDRFKGGLFDGDPKSNWQTSHYGSGTHFIKIFMKKDMVVK